jgi:hypothetical protein
LQYDAQGFNREACEGTRTSPFQHHIKAAMTYTFGIGIDLNFSELMVRLARVDWSLGNFNKVVPCGDIDLPEVKKSTEYLRYYRDGNQL